MRHRFIVSALFAAVLPGNVKRVHVGFDDPPRLAQGKREDEKLQIYRRVRDEIRDFVEGMPDNL